MTPDALDPAAVDVFIARWATADGTERANYQLSSWTSARCLASRSRICLDDAYFLGVLSSDVHRQWALSAGGRLGIGNDPTWTNTTCFATFPFPTASDDLASRIRLLAERLDAHRRGGLRRTLA